MGEYSEAFVAFDTSKVKHAVAIAEGASFVESTISVMSTVTGACSGP